MGLCVRPGQSGGRFGLHTICSLLQGDRGEAVTRQWHFFDTATGELLGRTFSGPESALAANTPPGAQPIEGAFDHRSQRVDLDTGHVIDWRPPQPDADHEWHPDIRRWRKTAAALATANRRAAAQARIDAAEARQLRAIREHILGDPTAKVRLRAIDAEIVAARADLA